MRSPSEQSWTKTLAAFEWRNLLGPGGRATWLNCSGQTVAERCHPFSLSPMERLDQVFFLSISDLIGHQLKLITQADRNFWEPERATDSNALYQSTILAITVARSSASLWLHHAESLGFQ